jgi:hypothetical protein
MIVPGLTQARRIHIGIEDIDMIMRQDYIIYKEDITTRSGAVLLMRMV